VEEARRMGLRVLCPDINRSRYEYRPEGRGIRVGLMGVKHLRSETIKAILRERKRKPFFSWEDFVRRVAPDSRELQALIQAGALDFLGEGRAAFFWKLAAKNKPPGTGGLFPGFTEQSGPPLPPLRESAARLREDEIKGLGFPLLPLDPAGDWPRPGNGIPPPSLIRAEEQLRWAGREVQFIGFPVTSRLTRTVKGGKLMKFLTLEDPSGLMEVVLFPDCYARYGHHLRGPGPFYLRGRLQVKDSVPTLICHFLSGLKFKP
jgi:DNA polymerase-3 subunit alpha